MTSNNNGINFYTMFSLPSCTYCDKAEDLLYSKLSEEELRCLWIINISDQPRTAEHLRSLGLKTVPQIFVNDTHIGGYNELEEYFERALV